MDMLSACNDELRKIITSSSTRETRIAVMSLVRLKDTALYGVIRYLSLSVDTAGLAVYIIERMETEEYNHVLRTIVSTPITSVIHEDNAVYAARVLAKIGGESDLELILAVSVLHDSYNRVLIERAIDSMRERLA